MLDIAYVYTISDDSSFSYSRYDWARKILNGGPDHATFRGWFVIHRLGRYMTILHAKFEVSISANYEHMKGHWKQHLLIQHILQCSSY